MALHGRQTAEKRFLTPNLVWSGVGSVYTVSHGVCMYRYTIYIPKNQGYQSNIYIYTYIHPTSAVRMNHKRPDYAHLKAEMALYARQSAENRRGAAASIDL